MMKGSLKQSNKANKIPDPTIFSMIGTVGAMTKGSTHYPERFPAGWLSSSYVLILTTYYLLSL